jgi:hypothetical protein
MTFKLFITNSSALALDCNLQGLPDLFAFCQFFHVLMIYRKIKKWMMAKISYVVMYYIFIFVGC